MRTLIRRIAAKSKVKCIFLTFFNLIYIALAYFVCLQQKKAYLKLGKKNVDSKKALFKKFCAVRKNLKRMQPCKGVKNAFR